MCIANDHACQQKISMATLHIAIDPANVKDTHSNKIIIFPLVK